MKKEFCIPRVVYLYDEGVTKIDFKQIKNFIKDNFGNIKVCLVRLKKKVIQTQGIIFDLIATKKAFEALEYIKEKAACHIILTDKLCGTFDEDKRVHIRASIYSFPSVISTSGIVEGPAKPKEYYLYKQRYTQLGVWDIEAPRVKIKFRKRFIDYQDKRLTEAIKGYIAQGIFFYLVGEPFCKKKECRLFNAHWQEDLIYIQIKSAKFCVRHKRALDEIKEIVAAEK